MMTKMREMTWVFIWILVIAFVGLMVLEWGMNITGLKGRSNVVGKINGKKITIQEFQKAIQNAYIQEKQRTGQEPDEEKLQQLRDQVWESYIQRILLGEEIKKHNIVVTDREIYLQITQNPPQELRENPNFQTNGKFDMEKYRQALQNPEINWKPVEDYYREVLPYQKLQDIITASVMVTEEEIKSEFMRRNMKARIRYLYIPAAAFARDSIQVSEEEMRRYYEEHKDDFKVEEKRKLNYVLFSIAPSPEDSARVYRLAEDILKDARSGADFNQLADEYSEDPSVKSNHGDLGFFERGRMVPEFEKAAFSGKPGDIVGPVKTQFGLHIIKIIEKKKEKGKEMVHAAHILLKFSASALTIEEAQRKANDFLELAKEDGFKVAADKLKYEIKQTTEFNNRGFIPGFGSMKAAADWAFKAKKGDISRVYRTRRGFVVFQVAEIKPAGYRPFEEVKGICKSKIEHQKRKERARQFAEKIQQMINEHKSFDEIARSFDQNRVKLDTTVQFGWSDPIPKIGRSATIQAAAFTLDLHKPSRMLETDRGFYFIEVIERTPFDAKKYAQQREFLKNQLLNQKRQRFFTEWYQKLKENADIEDNRSLFFSS